MPGTTPQLQQLVASRRGLIKPALTNQHVGEPATLPNASSSALVGSGTLRTMLMLFSR